MSFLTNPSLPDMTRPQPARSTIVIGAGPVGMRVAQDLCRMGRDVTVLSAEALPPYNRVRLTPLLGGEVQFGEIVISDGADLPDTLTLVVGARATKIDPDRHEVTTADGRVWPYDQLVLATGSRAFIPGIPGTELPNVFTFRDANDASALLARSFSARKVAVIGGGLLGLEAARGMRNRQCDVTVIEHEGHLMPRQLDKTGAAQLASVISSLGVKVLTGAAVREIFGDTRVGGLVLADGTEIECDTVIICTGIRANLDLARDAKLAFNRGVIVNDAMQTSAADIYAVGECAEHDGRTYGLVGPGYAQADVAARAMSGEAALFHGAAQATKLKVIGAEVFSAGDIEQLEVRQNVRSHVWKNASGYRRIFIERGKLVGAIAVGSWSQASRVQDAVQSGATVYPWMVFRFRTDGLLWSEADQSASDLPDSATLCNCTGVTCGQVRGALSAGCASVPSIGAETGAGTVCGSCRPLLAEMIDAGAKPEPIPLWKPVLGLSALAALGALVPFALGYVPLPTSYDAESLRVWLWRDNIVRQYSGFILLGITLAAFTIGLRKRLRFMDKLGGFDGWRLAHGIIGVSALAALLAHTGFNLGEGWNRALALTFLGVVLIGAVAGLATGGDHELRAHRIGSARKPPRTLPTWVHILAVWPLPALIALHVLASYAF